MTTPEYLAPHLGVPATTLRAWLRERYPKRAPGKGGRWELTTAMVVAAARHFKG